MKLSIDRKRGDILMEHRNEQLWWDSSPFERTDLIKSEVFDVFEPINAYWARLPPATQDLIFDLYKEIKFRLDSSNGLEELTTNLQDPVAMLMNEYHGLSAVRHWVDFHSGMIVPESIKTEQKFEDGSPATPEKTYNRDDYAKLVPVAVALRAMIPIWGEFIFRTKGECGNEFKEYYAYRLLGRTQLIQSEAIDKLLIYIEHQLPADRSTIGAVLGGISSEDFPIWLLARVLVRRLCIGDVSGFTPNSNIVKFIFKFIRQPNKAQKSSSRKGGVGFSDNIREKTNDSIRQEGENNLSRLENYKIQQEVSSGDVVIIRHYLKDPYRVALKLEPTLNLELLNQSLVTCAALENKIIDPAQRTLIQWVMKPAVSPRGIVALNKPTILKAMAITQSILWHRGHRDLAALVSATCRPATEEHRISGVETRDRLQRPMLEELTRLFPHYRRNRAKTGKVTNPAVTAIETMMEAFIDVEWHLTLPDAWLTQLTPPNHSRSYFAPVDIRVLIAKLVIECATNGRTQ